MLAERKQGFMQKFFYHLLLFFENCHIIALIGHETGKNEGAKES